MNCNCSACPLNGTAINIVQPDGPCPCDTMIIAEAPGKDEDESGLPFVGASGQLLNKILPMAGIKRDECFIVNCIRCRPPDNKLTKDKKKILECCTPQLLDEIESVNPKLIILLGATAINFFFPNEKMRQCHGLIRERDGRKFALMYHPAAALHAPRTGNDLIQDFKNLPFALRGFNSGGANQQGVTQDYKVIGPGEDATEIVQEIYEDARVSGKLAFDTETTSVDARTCELLGFSVCAQPGKAYYFTDFGWMHYLHEKLAGAMVDYVLHNAKYDIAVAIRHGIKLEPFLDTMVAAYVLRDGHLGLKELSQFRLNQHMDTLEDLFGKKALKDMKSLPLDKLGIYGAHDASCTLRLWYNVEPQLKVENAEKVYYDIDLPLIPVLVDMEATGVNIDITRAEKLDVELGVELLHATERIWTAAGKTFNINAPAQLGEILFERIGLPVISKTPSGAPSTDDEVLQDLKGRHPIVGDVLRYRALSKLVSTYVHKLPELIAPDTGRIHPDWNNCSTSTGRLCVHPDTPIEAPRDLTKYPDGIPLRELKVGDWVYSYDWDKHLVLKKVLWVGPTAVKPTLVIKLKGEWGQQTTLRVSHDHLVRMFAGHWLPAGKLKVGNRLCCMVRRGIDGWASFFPSSKRRVRGESGGKAKEHRVVYTLTHGMTSLPTQWDVHHKDGNKLNNHPNNLEFVYHPSHLAMHRKNTTKEEVIKMLSGESPMTICKQVLYRKAREYGLVPPGRQERNPKEKVMRMLSGEDPVTVHSRTLKNLARKYNLTAVNHTVVSIEEGPTEQLWDLEIEDTHTFIGSDVALHNSCSSPNAQNIPARTEEGSQVREIFTAPDNCYIVASDYSQIEPRLSAHLSGDEGMIAAFNAGVDIYVANASRTFGVPVDKVTKQMRSIQKTLNLGMSYGMSAYGFMAHVPDMKLTKQQAQKFIDNYFSAFPGVKQYIENTKTKARLLNYVESMMGRRRSIATNILDKRGQEAALREAINAPIQMSAADAIKLAMIKVYNQIKERQLKTRLVMQVHDELVFEVPEDELTEAVELIKECMVDVIPLSVPLPVDIEIGRNWKDLYAI